MKYRERLIIYLFKKSSVIYTRLFKKNRPKWKTKQEDLKYMPEDSFGYHLYHFLNDNNYQLIAKAENHDCYHVISNYSTSVEDEIALQFLCFGNGKRSLYLLGSIIVGFILLPEYARYFHQSYLKGKSYRPFYNFDFEENLKRPLSELRQDFTTAMQITCA